LDGQDKFNQSSIDRIRVGETNQDERHAPPAGGVCDTGGLTPRARLSWIEDRANEERQVSLFRLD
jgi:hypothetical protein